MIIILSLFGGAFLTFLVSFLVNRNGNEASHSAWYYFISENIKGCKTAKDCYLCNELIGMYGNRFCMRDDRYSHEMYYMLITQLHDKGQELMTVEVGTMTFEKLEKLLK